MPPIWKNIREVLPWPSGTAVAIGNFDGVHRGHVQVIRTLTSAAEATGTRAVAITFDPHPSRIIKPERNIQSINSLTENADRIFALGVQ